MAGAKFWTAVLVLNTAFISLSGASGEPQRCYWCGPLAEQVHRSRRSAPCGAANPVTACEPGYNYCAVVATSPPRVESRYCVKLYQDECYPLFCNSTKTWKMTCPCRGDLCNGPNTKRETEAFALLPKLVAKTHSGRIKKRTANASPHLIKHDANIRILNNDQNIHTNAKLIVNEDDNSDANTSQTDEMQSDQPTNIIIEHHGETEVTKAVTSQDVSQSTMAQLIEIEIQVSDPTESPVAMKENDQPCTELPTSSATEPEKLSGNTVSVTRQEMPETTVTEMVHTEPTIKTIESDIDPPSEEPVKTSKVTESAVKITESIIKNEEPVQTTEVIRPDPVDVKITAESITKLSTTPTEVMPNDEPAKDVEEQMQNDAPPINPTANSEVTKTTEETKVEEPSTKENVKPSKEMPTAEALQQNGSPLVTENTTPAATVQTTIMSNIVTTQESNAKRTSTAAPSRGNGAIRVTLNYALLISCIVYL